MAKILDKIIKFNLYLLVFLLPIFWLPFSFETYEFNKIYLLFFLVSLAFLAWLAKMVLVDKEIRFRKSPIDVPVLLFLLVAILSTIFSVDKSSSIFGFYGRFSNGLITLLSLGMLYFLITNNVKPLTHFDGYPADKKQINTDKENKEISINQPKSALISVNGLVKAFFWSVFFVVLISYLSIFGVWLKFPKLPFVMQQRTFNPVSGSLEGLAIFLAIVTVLLVGRRLIAEPKEKKFSTIISYLLLAGAMGLLIIINYSSAWIILLASLGSFLIFALVTRIFREDVNRLLLPIFLIILALIFLFLNTTNLFKLPLPQEQVLEQGISWKVAFKTATENVKNGFLGSGIGTYYFDFVKNKPVEFNKNLWWQIRFDRAGSYVAEIFGTMGFLGFFALLTIFIIYFLVNWLLVQSKVDSSSSPFLLAILALFFSQFFYYQNTVLAFTFWLILGLGVTSWQKPIQEKAFSFKDFPELSLVFSTLLILFFFGVLMTYYFGIRFYLADINYLKGQLVLGEERTRFLERAVSLNQSLATYQVVLARSYLLQIFEETAKPPAEIDAAKVQNLVAKAINQAKIATELSPNSVSVWETSGMIYRDIQPLATGAADWAIKSFERAITLEPQNPVLYTELGKLYLGQNDLQKARENFAKAKGLKSDYVDALIQEALVLEGEQKFDEAIGKMEELARNYPFSIDVKFQLGRLYFNKDRVDEAITQFENIITLLPNHSNSLYSLGLAYTKKGEKEKAIASFEKVLQLNPGNQDVIQKLEELRK